MKDVQCYELFVGIAHKNHAFSFHFSFFHLYVIQSKYIGRVLTEDVYSFLEKMQ